MYFELFCPRVYIYGHYRAVGELFNMPIDGEGRANIVFYNELMKVRATLGIIDNFDNKPYMYIEKYYTQYIPKGPVLLDFENLHRTRKDIGDTVHRFINKYSKEVVLEYQHPVFDVIMKKIMTNTNKFLATVPIEEHFYDFY